MYHEKLQCWENVSNQLYWSSILGIAPGSRHFDRKYTWRKKNCIIKLNICIELVDL